jgi:hypothetical protein
VRSIKGLFASCLLVLGLGLTVALPTANAAPPPVGSWAVYDGPHWTTNPEVLSARETAALLFGGNAEDYMISILPDAITFTAFYDGWGEHTGMIFDQDYKLDEGAPGYNDPGGLNTARSAFVHDGLSDTQRYRNYAWLCDPVNPNPVPEPATMATMGLGLPLLGWMRRRKNRKA